MNDVVKVFTLGGLDENGKNCTVVEIGGDLFVVSCGLKYPDKTMPGIDYIITDAKYLVEHKKQVKAYLLPHGHEDEMGGLAYIYREVPAPIYGSSVSLALFGLFLKSQGFNPHDYEMHKVEATSDFVIDGHRIHFFQTSHSVPASSGVALETSFGNVVITSDFVVENNADPSYLFDMNAIASLGEKPTLVLLSESIYADHGGYTAPRYKLRPLIEQEIKDAKGRVFISLFLNNCYNIDEVIHLAIETRKKIVPYDQESEEMIKTLQAAGEFKIPRDHYASSEDLNRLRDVDMIVLVLGSGVKLYNKVALLAAGQNETRKCYLKATDTFIVASPSNDNTELEATDALDELYRSGVKVLNFTRKTLFGMHASEEDLKMMIALLKPRYYLPIKGFYKDLLANAEVALETHTGLNHQNVFLLENGLSAIFDQNGGRLFDEKIPHGDIMIDGSGVGDVGKEVLADRSKLANGVVILAATISRSKQKVIAGPDVQMWGLVYLKESDLLLKEINRLFNSCLNEALKEKPYDLSKLKDEVYEKTLRLIKRQTGKEPMVLPLLLEIS